MCMKSKIIVLFFLFIFVNIFHVYAQDIYEHGGPFPGYNDTKKECLQHPKVDCVLYELTKAEDYNKFAQENGLLDVIDNKVRVYLELNNNKFALPSDFGTEEIRLEDYNLIQALVRIDKLLTLADNPNIRLIRIPGKETVTQDSSVKPTTQQVPSKSSINPKLIYYISALGVIIILFVIYLLFKKKK